MLLTHDPKSLGRPPKTLEPKSSTSNLIVYLVTGTLAQMSRRTFPNTESEAKAVLRARGVKVGQVHEMLIGVGKLGWDW